MGTYSGLRFGPSSTYRDTSEGDGEGKSVQSEEACGVRYYPGIDAYIFARTYRNSSEEPAWPSLGCTTSAAPPSHSALVWYASYMLHGNVTHSPWSTTSSQSSKEEEEGEEEEEDEEGEGEGEGEEGANVSDGPIFLYRTPSLPASSRPPLQSGATRQASPVDAPPSTLAISALDYPSVNGPNFQTKTGKGLSGASRRAPIEDGRDEEVPTEARQVSSVSTEAPSAWYGVSMTSIRGNVGSVLRCRCVVCHCAVVSLCRCASMHLCLSVSPCRCCQHYHCVGVPPCLHASMPPCLCASAPLCHWHCYFKRVPPPTTPHSRDPECKTLVGVDDASYIKLVLNGQGRTQ